MLDTVRGDMLSDVIRANAKILLNPYADEIAQYIETEKWLERDPEVNL